MLLKKTKIYRNSGFYYVGKNTDSVEKLLSSFKRGHAFEMLENAKSELIRSLKNDNNIIPEVIFCDASFDIAEIKSFRQYLNNDPVLSSIPFILDGSGSSEKELNYYRRNKILDEIVFLNNFHEKTIFGKIQFLKKVKSSQVESSQNHELKSTTPVQYILKRGFDITVSLTILILLSPLFLLIALAVKLESRGPVFYIAKRAGKGYKIFDFYKFRTMEIGADEKINDFSHLNLYNDKQANGPVFIKINNDPRITRVGSFLKKYQFG